MPVEECKALSLLKVSAQAGELVLIFALQTAELAEKEKEVAHVMCNPFASAGTTKPASSFR